jgi:hypothetical protein
LRLRRWDASDFSGRFRLALQRRRTTTRMVNWFPRDKCSTGTNRKANGDEALLAIGALPCPQAICLVDRLSTRLAAVKAGEFRCVMNGSTDAPVARGVMFMSALLSIGSCCLSDCSATLSFVDSAIERDLLPLCKAAFRMSTLTLGVKSQRGRSDNESMITQRVRSRSFVRQSLSREVEDRCYED